MKICRVEKWGDVWRLVAFRNAPSTRQRDQPRVHKVSHEDEGEFWERKWQEEEEDAERRFDSSISRARSRVRELAYCNSWDYFATFTLAEEKQDRFDLRQFVKDFGNWIGNYNKKYKCSLKYIIIPERHKSGAWHAHGLLSGLAPDSLIINEHGYLDLPYYRARFGFISLSRIRDNKKTANYVTKYITKDSAATADTMQKNAHLFYASRGLKGRDILWQGASKFDGGYNNLWCTVKYTSSWDEVTEVIRLGCNYADTKRYFILSDIGSYKRYSSRYRARALEKGSERQVQRSRAREDSSCDSNGVHNGGLGKSPSWCGRGEGALTPTLTEEELEQCRRAHEVILLRRKEENRIALSVSRPVIGTPSDLTQEAFGEQLTFLGLLNDGGGLHNGT